MEKIKINRRAYENNAGGLYVAEYVDNTLVRYGYSDGQPTASIVEDLRGDLTHWTNNYSDPASLAEFAADVHTSEQIGLLDEDGDVFVWPTKAGVAGLDWMGLDCRSCVDYRNMCCLGADELSSLIDRQHKTA